MFHKLQKSSETWVDRFKHLKSLQLDPNKSSVKHILVKMSKVLAEAPKNSKKTCQVTLKRRLIRHTVDLAGKKKLTI